MIMSPIEANLQQIHREKDAVIAGRPANSDQNLRQNVTLVAVSKTKPAAVIVEAFQAGQRHFGENYVQEGVAKVAELAALGLTRKQGLVWHFIGPLQSNKAKLVAHHFDWVHGVDRLKIAAALSNHRDASLAPLNVCVQVNVSGENSKSGVDPQEARSLATEIATLPNLNLRGLMTIIENTPSVATQRAQFQKMHALWLTLRRYPPRSGMMIDTLSMGMSQDFKIAIEEGSTMIRIGSAIFGARN